MSSVLLKLVAAVCSGLILSSAFPPWNQGTAVWLFLYPLMAALWLGNRTDESVTGWWKCSAVWRRPFVLGWIAGFAHFMSSLTWVRHSSRVLHGAYGNEWMGWGVELLGWSAAVGLSLYCALYFGVWAAFADTVARPRREKLLSASMTEASLEALRCSALAAGAWVTLEWVRGWMLTGFGWNGLGVGLHENKLLIQAADLVGVAGLSFTPVFLTSVVFLTFWRVALHAREGRGFRRHFDLAAAVALVGAQMIYGASRFREAPQEAVPLRVALVQQNVPQVDRWTATPDKIVDIYRRYSDLTELYAGAREGRPSAVDLVVWPESALLLPWYHRDHEPFLDQLLAKGDFALLAGVDTDDPMVGVYNSAVLVQDKASEAMLHHKLHLVPFGEYVPGRNLIPGMDAMFRAILPGDIARGTSTEPLRLKKPDVDLIPLICFEDTVGRVARKFIRENRPQVLVNLTNDGWFLSSEENEVHLNNSLFRAVELRRSLCRAANTGITAVVDARGVLTARLQDPETKSPFIQGVLPAELQLDARAETTVYARWGDWFAVVCLASCLLGGWFTRRNSPRVRRTSSDG